MEGLPYQALPRHLGPAFIDREHNHGELGAATIQIRNSLKEKAMAVAWIQQLYNDTQLTFSFRSQDDSNNGNVGGTLLDDGNWHTFPGPKQYPAEWCGIPWQHYGQHYKDLSSNANAHILRFWTSGPNIEFADGISGQPVGEIGIVEFGGLNDVDLSISLRPGGIYFDTLDPKTVSYYVIDSNGAKREVDHDGLANVLGNVAGGTVPLGQERNRRHHHKAASGAELAGAREESSAS